MLHCGKPSPHTPLRLDTDWGLTGVSVCRQAPFITAETGSGFLRAAVAGLQHALVAFVTILIVPSRVASVGRFEVGGVHAFATRLMLATTVSPEPAPLFGQARAAQSVRTYAIIVTALTSLLQTGRLSLSTREAAAAHPLEFDLSYPCLASWQLGTGATLSVHTRGVVASGIGAQFCSLTSCRPSCSLPSRPSLLA